MNNYARQFIKWSILTQMAIVMMFADTTCIALGSPAVGISPYPNLFVGYPYVLTITGGAPNAEVIVCDPRMGCFTAGYTNQYGQFVMNGTPSEVDLGDWNETWTVGGVAASPNPLQFTVYPAAYAGCELQYPSSTSFDSTDIIEYGSGQILYQFLGNTTIQAYTNPNGACHMYGVNFSPGSFTSATRMNSGTFQDTWMVYDTGIRTGYSGDPGSYYPRTDTAYLTWIAVNIITGKYYSGTTTIWASLGYQYY